MNIRSKKRFLPIVIVVVVLAALGLISFFTATHWIFLTAQEPGQSPEPSVLTCKLTNYSVRPIYHGARFTVGKWVEDHWEELPAPEGLIFTLGISVVWPFSSVTLQYPTSLFTESHGDGLFRIGQNAWVGDARTAEERTLYCEFTLGANDPTPEKN